MVEVTPAALVEAINRQHGSVLAWAGRFLGGEQGAYRVSDAAGDLIPCNCVILSAYPKT
jgi:hypothetical protein